MGKPMKYTTSFSSQISSVKPDTDIQESIARESLESLKEIAPSSIDWDQNADLLGVAFNAALANRFNKNGDGIDAETAIKIKDYFIHKPTNIEHQKTKIVGHVVGASLSDYKTSTIISSEAASSYKAPFNISLSAVLYRTVNPDFINLVERSVDEEDELFQKISASWEIGFNQYKIALGSSDLQHAEIISDEKLIADLTPYLKQHGGSGKTDDGVDIYRLIAGEIYPLGIGFTTNPAADVKGLTKIDDKKTVFSIAPKTAYISDLRESFKKEKKEKVSHLNEKDVFLDEEPKDFNIMETQEIITKLEQVLASQSEKNISEQAVANVAQFLHDTILERNDLWTKEKETLEGHKQEMLDKAAAKEADLEKLQEELSASNLQLSELQTELKSKIAADNFNDRMSEIDDMYDLDDEDRVIVASDLKSVDDQGAYDSFKGKLAISWKHKTKAFKLEQEKVFAQAVEEEVAKRLQSSEVEEIDSPDEVTASAMENVQEEAAAIPNNNGESTEEEMTLREKFQKSFNRENVSIQY